MAEKTKSVRLINAAKELGVGTSTISKFLTEKGFEIDNKPTSKLSSDMYQLLLEEFQSDKVLKERSQQIELGKSAKEDVTINKEPEPKKEEEKENEEVLIKSMISESPEISKAEEKAENPDKRFKTDVTPLKGPTVVGKIELPTKKKKVEKEEEKPEPEKKAEPKREKVPEPEQETVAEVTEEEEIKQPADVPQSQSEKIVTKYESLEGPKVVGKIDLPADRSKKKKLVASSSESFVSKRKKRRITQRKPALPENKEADKSKDFKKKKRARFKVDEKEVNTQLKATLAKIGTKKGTPKHKRLKRTEEGAEGEQIEENILEVTEFISVSELASLMDVPVTQIITACMNLGVMVTMNQRIDAEIIELVTEEFGYTVKFTDVKEQDEMAEEQADKPEDLVERPPIVTIMGHVDHGKTSLLDYIRKSNVIAGEAGGITQHIGAYSVVLDNDKIITFLDTPGHEAFTAMRARGAKATDIAVIVIAADDQVMPQTREAISHAQAAGVSMIFAINKIDKPGANAEKIKEQLSAMNILVEDWGGNFQCQEIAAKHGTNVDKLQEKILIDAELQELKANPEKLASGTIIEASLDKGKGYVTTVLVQSGTLKVGDFVLAGTYYGRIKAMADERGNKLKEAGPSLPAQVLGLNGAPQAGDKFKVYVDEQEVKYIANKRSQIIREQGIRASKHITLDEIGRRLALGNFQELNLIVKGDVDGSVEALCDSLGKLSNEEIQVKIIHKGVGQITESDILLASASDALIVGFQVRPSSSARRLAEQEGIDIKLYSIIYKAIEEIQSAIEGMLAPTIEEKITCNIEIREVFKISRVGTIAGCYVTEGKINRNTKIRLIREGIVIYSGELTSLKRYKDDVKEVSAGMECGLSIKNYNDIKVGDIVEGYEQVEVKRKI